MGKRRKESGEREAEKRRWGGNNRLEPESFKREESVPWLVVINGNAIVVIIQGRISVSTLMLNNRECQE